MVLVEVFFAAFVEVARFFFTVFRLGLATLTFFLPTFLRGEEVLPDLVFLVLFLLEVLFFADFFATFFLGRTKAETPRLNNRSSLSTAVFKSYASGSV